MHKSITTVAMLNDWIDWALKYKQNPTVIAFLRMRPELFGEIDPKNWVLLANYQSIHQSYGMNYEGYKTIIDHSGVATEFMWFVKSMESIPTLCEVVNDPENVKIPKGQQPQYMYQMVTYFGQRATKDNIGALFTFFNRFHGTEFTVLFYVTAVKTDPSLMETKEVLAEVTKLRHLMI